MHPLDNFDKMFALEQIAPDTFRGFSAPPTRKRIFGGQLVAQALRAASLTVQDVYVHSFHAYFLRPATPRLPVDYQVAHIRDSSYFHVRRVTASQEDTTVFIASLSFHCEENGFSHQIEMPEVPEPEQCICQEAYLLEQHKKDPKRIPKPHPHPRPIDERFTKPINWYQPEQTDGPLIAWIRAREPLADDPIIHQCVLAYCTDLIMVNNALLKHCSSWADRRIITASLDHAVWFHRPCNPNKWLLYVQDSPSAQNALGYNRGSIFTRDGVLVASAAQEGLMRIVEPVSS
jgi:acyl-CoA thioesterase-2